MYTLLLVLCTAMVVLSPLALDLYLTACEQRGQRRRLNQAAKAKGPSIAWASPRLH